MQFDQSDFEFVQIIDKEIEVVEGGKRKKKMVKVEVTGLYCYGCCVQKVKKQGSKSVADAFRSQQELDDWEKQHYTTDGDYRRNHFGHGLGTVPIFRFIEVASYYICVLHLLLRIVGALWKHCIGSRITDNTQATKLTSLLHNKLRVYVAPLKTNSKQEIKDRAKNISLTGEETVRVAEHFEDCVDVVSEPFIVVGALLVLLSL